MAGVDEVAVGLYAKIFYEDDKTSFITVPLDYVKNYESILEKPPITWKFYKKSIWFEPEEGDTSKAEYKNGFVVEISDDLQQLSNSSSRVSTAPSHLVLSSEGENINKNEAKKRKSEKIQKKELNKQARILREQELLDGMPSTAKHCSKDDKKDEFARKQDLLNKVLSKYRKPPRKSNKNNEGKNKEPKSRRNSKNGMKPAKNKKIDDESTLKVQAEFQNLDEEREDILSMTFQNNIQDFIAPMQNKRTVLQAAMLKAKNIFPELLSNCKEVPSDKSKANQGEDSGEPPFLQNLSPPRLQNFSPPLSQDISPQCPEIVNLNSRRQSKEQPEGNEQIEHTFSEKSSSSEQNSSPDLAILHSDSKDDKIKMLEISLKKKEEELELLKKNHKIQIDALENMYRRLQTAAGNSQISEASETSNGKKTEKLGEGVEVDKVWLSNNRTIQRSAAIYTGLLLVEILGEEVLRKSSYSGHSRDGSSKNPISANVIAAVKNEVHGWLVTHKSFEKPEKAMEHLDQHFTVWVNRKIQSIQPVDPNKKKLKTGKPNKVLPARKKKVPSSSLSTNGVVNDSSTDEESDSEGDEKSASEADESYVPEADE